MTLPPTILLVRHATPDWSRTDLPYHLPPGPPLTRQGEAEADELGTFLRSVGVVQIWTSPLERAWRTAEIAARKVPAPVVQSDALGEWQPGEQAEAVRARLRPAWETAFHTASLRGPVALVTHGGPIGALLETLGLPAPVLADYRRRFDRSNPLPPAGVWQARQATPGAAWELSLVHLPETVRRQQIL